MELWIGHTLNTSTGYQEYINEPYRLRDLIFKEYPNVEVYISVGNGISRMKFDMETIIEQNKNLQNRVDYLEGCTGQLLTALDSLTDAIGQIAPDQGAVFNSIVHNLKKKFRD